MLSTPKTTFYIHFWSFFSANTATQTQHKYPEKNEIFTLNMFVQPQGYSLFILVDVNNVSVTDFIFLGNYA